MAVKRIGPQKGPQELFMSSSADVVIYGGAAGGGKTFALLLECLRHIKNKDFTAVIFRHSYNQITAAGGLWDTSYKVFGNVKGAIGAKTPKYHWKFPSGASVGFAHIARNTDVQSWQGSQICLEGFDELCHFTDYQFFYMLSRNRSDSGVIPYIRATCNPDSDSWVAKFISWWIDQDTGYAIPERSGVIRYMARTDGKITWGDSREELIRHGFEDIDIKSVTFILSTLADNQILMKADPSYLSNLRNLPYVEREQLLNGNWKVKNAAGLMFKRSQVRMIPREMIKRDDILQLCRAWDLAATTTDERGDPAYTAGVLMAIMKNGDWMILDVINMRLSAGDVANLILNTAISDKATYGYVRNRVPQDPGQSGKAQAEYYIKALADKGFDIVARTETGNKEHRATPVAAVWQHGFVQVMVAEWNDMYFSELEGFPEGKFKDMVDATSSAYDELTNYMEFNVDNLI